MRTIDNFLECDEFREILVLVESQPKKYLQEALFKKEFDAAYRDIQQIEFPSGFSFQQKLYHCLYNDLGLELGKCKVCGKRTKFVRFSKGYCNYCSSKCAHNSNEVIEKTKATNFEKYGVDNPSKNKKVREKVRQTTLEIYGCECSLCNDNVRKKAIATNIERYGTEYPLQSVAVRKKMIDTNGIRYGCDYPLQNSDILNRAKETMISRYGVDNSFKLDSVRSKSKRTIQEKYGVEHITQSKEVQEKIRKTSLEKYGCEHPSQNEDVKRKLKSTNLEKYGVEYTMLNENVENKIKATNVEKYGVEYPFQSVDVQTKCKDIIIEKYGVPNIAKLDDTKNKIKKTNIERYGVEWFCQTDAARNHSNNSKPNLNFSKMLDEINIEYCREFSISSYSYDFKIGDALVEINPTITHNSALNIFGKDPKRSTYHLDKSKCANENGFICIHVWDWDDQRKIANMFKPKETLYARTLEVREVLIGDANIFLNAYHLQGTCKGQTIIYGLYMNDILVEVMSFGKPRYNRNYEFELLRLCTHNDYNVVGGAERLFKHFVKEHNPKSVISYCDLCKFRGDVYGRLGFALNSVSQPTRHWYDLKTKRHITDSFLRQRGFDQLFGTDYGKGTSNKELMLEYGFLPVYDCGQATFIYE